MKSEKNSSVGYYHFVLYIDSAKPKSFHVADRLRHLCRQHLIDTYTLDIVDLHENPLSFEQQRVVAVPTLDVTTPQARQHRFVGDLSQSEMFIMAVGMVRKAGRMGEAAGRMRQAVKKMRGGDHVP